MDATGEDNKDSCGYIGGSSATVKTPMMSMTAHLKPQHFKDLPVEKQDEILGMLSAGFYLSALSYLEHEVFPGIPGDDTYEIRARILSEALTIVPHESEDSGDTSEDDVKPHRVAIIIAFAGIILIPVFFFWVLPLMR